MEKNKIEIANLDEISAAVDRFFDICKSGKKFAFYGEMGSGKTTFITAVCKALKVNETIASPTYSLVNEYSCPDGIVYHLDLYRLEDVHEALDIGIEQILESDGWCFIEWPQIVEAILPDDFIKVSIGLESNKRIIEIN